MTRPSPNTVAKARPRAILTHHRLLICAVIGAAVAVGWPDIGGLLGRVLLGWNVLCWVYLAWVGVMLRRAEEGHMKRVALAQAESAGTVLSVVVIAAVTSLVAVVFELAAAKAGGPSQMLGHVIAALVTVVGSWLLLPVLFALTYAAAYYEPEPDAGLEFPGAGPGFEPDHTDFFYFAFTIAVTAQTSDVAVTSRRMRRLVLLQSVLSFLFNTTILAFSINAAASFF